MLLLIDNYDSFTWNLVHYIGEVMEEAWSAKGGAKKGAKMGHAPEIRVERNDALTAKQAAALKPQAIVLSPGPCDPDRAGICLNLIREASADTPILGVCLGHQAIGQAFGGEVVRAKALMHGKTSPVHHRGGGLFRDLAEPMTATRYHSLIVKRETLPDCLEIDAETDDGVIMGFHHKSQPTYGVQFHPESIATENGRGLLRNFLKLAEVI